MLAHLHVKNLALIEEIEVEFGPGLNILCTCGAAFSGRKRESTGDTESTGYLSGRWTGTSVQKNHGWKKHQQD